MTVAGEMLPFFAPLVMTSRLATSRKLISWPCRCRGHQQHVVVVDAAPLTVLPRLRADS